MATRVTDDPQPAPASADAEIRLANVIQYWPKGAKAIAAMFAFIDYLKGKVWTYAAITKEIARFSEIIAARRDDGTPCVSRRCPGEHWQKSSTRRGQQLSFDELGKLPGRRVLRPDEQPCGPVTWISSQTDGPGRYGVWAELGFFHSWTAKLVMLHARRYAKELSASSALPDLGFFLPKAMKPRGVSIHPSLARAIRQAKAEPQYKFWVVAKGLMARGTLATRGACDQRVSVEVLVRELANLPARPLGAAANIRTLLARCRGHFLDESQGYVYLYSPDRVARQFGLGDAGGSVMKYPLEDVRAGIAAWRALIDNTLLPSGPALVLSRSTVAELTGTPAATQRARERLGVALYHDGNGVVPVASPPTWADYSELVTAGQSMQEVARAHRSEGFFTYTDFKTGEAKLLRQEPKTFQRYGVGARRHRTGSEAISTEEAHSANVNPVRRRSPRPGAKEPLITILPTDDPGLRKVTPGSARTVAEFLEGRDVV